MVVGEPTLMGGEFGDEDERLITRLENSQFEPNLCDDGSGGGMDGADPSGQGPPHSSQYNSSPMHNSPWGSDKKPPARSGTPGGEDVKPPPGTLSD
jgi:LIM domain-binding protein 1